MKHDVFLAWVNDTAKKDIWKRVQFYTNMLRVESQHLHTDRETFTAQVGYSKSTCACVCVPVCVCMRACVRVRVCACMHVCMYYPGQKKTATTIMHKIRTLFLSRNITRLARWRGLPRLCASLHRSAIKLDFSISNYQNSVLILCIIVEAVFFFLAR